MFAPKDYATLYAQLGRLLQTAPDMSTYLTIERPEVLQWVGRAAALVGEVEATAYDLVSLTTAVDHLRTGAWKAAVTQIFAIVYRAHAKCESRLPVGSGGTFIPVGNAFDAFAALAKILQSAKADVMIVDPYMDESALTEFGLTVPTGISLRLMADEASHKPSLAPAAAKWISQHGTSRPVAVRLAAPKSLHDRAIFIDGSSAWTLTQSLKDFAKRSPAEIVRADDTASLKIAAYEQIWSAATPLV